MRRLHAVDVGRFHRRWDDRVRLILVPGLCLVLLGGCGAGASDDPAGEAGEAPAVPVETGTVVLGDISAFYEGTAALEAEEQAVVVAKTTGVVLEILVEEGDEVVAGQVLARLERDRYELEAARTKATFERLTHELVRAAELHKRQLISAEDYDRARFEAEAQRAAYEQAPVCSAVSASSTTPAAGYRDALLSEDGRYAAFVIDEHQVAARREVLIGYEEGGMVEVAGGLDAGDVVVTAGKDSLRDGAKVAIISTGSDEAAGNAAPGIANR